MTTEEDFELLIRNLDNMIFTAKERLKWLEAQRRLIQFEKEYFNEANP